MTAADSAPPIPRSAVPALALAAFGSGVSLRVTDALLPLFARSFAVDLAQAASVITAFSVAYGLSQLFFGPLGDRFGKVRVITWGCVACAITSGSCGLAQGLTQLTLARLCAGATSASIIPLAMAWIGDVIPYERRQPVLARFLIGQILGLSSGVFVGGLVADHMSWRLPFFGLSLAFVVISAVLFSVLRQLPTSTPVQVQGSALRRNVHEFARVLAEPWARVVLGTVFLEGACVYGSFAFIATHLHREFGVALSTAGSVVMWFGFGGLLFAFGAGQLVRRLGEVGLARGGGVLLAASLLCVGLAPAWQWSVPACFAAGLGFYMLHNTLQINATQMAPQRRGAAVAAFASCFFLGQATGVAMLGALVTRWGTGLPIALGAVGTLLVALNFGRLRAAKAPPATVTVTP